MNYQTLHTAIDAYIKRNGRQEITGNILNGVLSLMTDTLGEGYQFGGVISPDTIFMPTDAKELFICSEPGTYISFGGIVAEEGELTLITYSDGFEKSVITGVGGAEGAVKYDEPQTLTQAQQTQARNNIDAASKAQVTRIALNVGFTDKIKDTATTLEDLSNKVSIINVIDGDHIAGCILPSSQTGQIGWLYEFEEGWMLTKDVSSYEVGEHTWEDLLWYLDANSGKIVNAIRLGLVTGDLSTLTTTDKSTLVAAINEVNADKASSAALTAEVTRATAAEGALSGEIGDLSSLQTTAKDNLVNAINEVAQGGGGGSEWEFIKDIVIPEPVHSVHEALGGEYKELFITFDTALLIVNASGTGVADKFYFYSLPSEAVYGQMLQSAQTPGGAYPRAAYMWVRQFGNFRVMTSCVNATVAGPQYTFDCYAVVPALNHTFTEVHISAVNSANNINANTIHIYGKR